MKSLITAFDLLGIGVALSIMGVGLARRWRFWRMKKPAAVPADWGGLWTYLSGHRDILRRPSVGMAHLAAFWGVILPLALILLAQFGGAIPGVPARLLSVIQDLTGAVLLAGVIYFLIRRMGLREADGPRGTLFPAALLLIIVVSGFLAEGARLNLLGTAPAWASPVGSVVSLATPASPLFMQLMIRVHFFAVLLLITAVPFTFMRHAAAAPLNVLYRKKGPRAALTPVDLDAGETGANMATDFSWKQLLDAEACVACGRCAENCPATISGKPLSPRKVMGEICRQVEIAACGCRNHETPRLDAALSDDEIWACTTCMACVEHCPVFAEPLDKIVDMRRHRVMGEARLPSEARPMIRNLELYGDIQGKGAAHRADWAMHRDVPHIAEAGTNAEVLLWVGCSGAFHPRNQETGRALFKIFRAAGVAFGTLGREEVCCGDPARRLGTEDLYRNLAARNIALFERYGVRKIVTLCPHCLTTLKNDYADQGFRAEVVHATAFVMDLIRKQRLTLKYPVADTMTIHDACYLGRYNQVYEPPRELCKAVPNTRLLELPRNRESGFCCGGGGGRMWLHENIGKNINVLRSEEIAEHPVDVIGTSCPYCLVMLDDGVKSLELEKTPKVMDIIDIVADSLGVMP